VPARERGLPTIYLSAAPKTDTSLPLVYMCEAEGAGCRLKWLASTCLAGLVGVCLIGVSIYASMNVEDGSGMMNSIRRASIAAMEPMRKAQVVEENQFAAGQKSDRIQMTAAGFATQHVIHESVVKREGAREYITIKPYLRIVAGLATEPPEGADEIPPFNPYKLYTDNTPIQGEDESQIKVAQDVTLNVWELPGGALPAEDNVELKNEDVLRIVAEAAENFAYSEEALAMQPEVATDPMMEADSGSPFLQRVAYRPEQLSSPPLRNMTEIRKTADEPEDAPNLLPEGSETKTVTVGRGDTMYSIITKFGAEPALAKAIADAMEPIFPASELKPKQEVRCTLAPAPSDTGQMEPIRVSVYDPDIVHRVTVSKDQHGDFVASNKPIEALLAEENKSSQPQRATLYTSFYHALASQQLPAETITNLLRVHSYDVDFKQRVRPGDSFEVFIDSSEGQDAGDTAGEVLHTSMTVNGETRAFWRFRTSDGLIDYYDAQGNSAKKFLMRNPVKGGRYTSGFGDRRHPLLRYMRMHTGVDWAAPTGTPIFAAGDGTVEMAERYGGYGNYIRIKHANGFSTAYAHLSRYASGLEPGVQVRQGQVIGFVGSTGLSTGPHLHYEIMVNGRFVNPMTIQVPRGMQLTGRQLAEFHKERKRIDALMQMDPVTTARVAEAKQ
jgi:murein DD-endopeptidase MepM/ murein hydrolase activator NlpD